MSKRVNYLHYILNLHENELLKKFFICQSENAEPGDWYLTVLEDLKKLNIDLSFNQIKVMKKLTFKKLVKKKCNIAALELSLIHI